MISAFVLISVGFKSGEFPVYCRTLKKNINAFQRSVLQIRQCHMLKRVGKSQASFPYYLHSCGFSASSNNILMYLFVLLLLFELITDFLHIVLSFIVLLIIFVCDNAFIKTLNKMENGRLLDDCRCLYEKKSGGM